MEARSRSWELLSQRAVVLWSQLQMSLAVVVFSERHLTGREAAEVCAESGEPPDLVQTSAV
jgi:hypothetical protein